MNENILVQGVSNGVGVVNSRERRCKAARPTGSYGLAHQALQYLTHSLSAWKSMRIHNDIWHDPLLCERQVLLRENSPNDSLLPMHA